MIILTHFAQGTNMNLFTQKYALKLLSADVHLCPYWAPFLCILKTNTCCSIFYFILGLLLLASLPTCFGLDGTAGVRRVRLLPLAHLHEQRPEHSYLGSQRKLQKYTKNRLL